MAEEEESKPAGKLLSGDVRTVLREMSTPMLVGLVAMIMVNLIDTYWVSRLGTEALAAMTFTFPVESVVINIALGLMIGTSVAVSRAVDGEGGPKVAMAGGVAAVVAVAGALGLRWRSSPCSSPRSSPADRRRRSGAACRMGS